MPGEDWKLTNFQPIAQNNVQFGVRAEKETFFEARDIINRNIGKFTIYEMPPIFDITSILGFSHKFSTLQHFLESCFLIAKDPDALE